MQEFFQVQTYEERQKVRQILIDLVKAGQAKFEVEEGVYLLSDKPGARGAVQAKLWEFACLRFATAKPFTAAEAARLAECDRDYTKRYCRWLWETGYLAIVTRGRAGAWLYQVVGGKEHEPAPPWNRRAEKRKSRGQGPGAGGQNEEQKPEEHRLETCATAPPATLPKTIMSAALEAEKLSRVGEILAEMETTLAALSGDCVLVVGLFQELKAAILEKEDGHGTDGHH
jgi:hypothetical protein